MTGSQLTLSIGNEESITSDKEFVK